MYRYIHYKLHWALLLLTSTSIYVRISVHIHAGFAWCLTPIAQPWPLVAGAADPRAAPDTAVTDTRLRRREQPQGQSTLCVHRVPALAKHLLVHCVVLDNNKHQNPFKLPLSCVCWDTQLHVCEPNKNNIPMFVMTFDVTMSCPTCIQYHLSALRTCIYDTSICMSWKQKWHVGHAYYFRICMSENIVPCGHVYCFPKCMSFPGRKPKCMLDMQLTHGHAFWRPDMQYGLSNCLLDMHFIKLKMHVHKLKFLMMGQPKLQCCLRPPSV